MTKVGRIANRLAKAIKSVSFPGHPNISNAKIEKLDLISRLSIIHNSELTGNVAIGDFTKVIDAKIVGNVQIGRWTTFNGPNSDIYALLNKVQIGNFCSIARNVSIQEYDHFFDRITSYFIFTNMFGEEMKSEIVSQGNIIIGNDVWVGTHSVVLSGAIISDGAVIGANSLVNSFIPPYAVAAGSPAKVLKYRFTEQLIERLLKIKWWDWDDERIRATRALFDGPLTEEKLNKCLVI
jgi:virginiamycin A acetyltransferase